MAEGVLRHVHRQIPQTHLLILLPQNPQIPQIPRIPRWTPRE